MSCGRCHDVLRMLLFCCSEEWSTLTFPRSASDVSSLSVTLSRYKRDHFTSVVLLFCLSYIFLQSFAIPGPVFLSLLSGPLFGFRLALFLVSLSATAGASCCYWLSFFLARSTVERFFPSLLSSLRSRIDSSRHSGRLLYHLIFLRISPLLPNWFINTATPHLHVPFTTFLAATAVGLLPANYIHVTTGMQVEGLTEGSGGWQETLWRIAGLFLLAFLALLPTLWTKRTADTGKAEDKKE
jgi:transmembrane protein 41